MSEKEPRADEQMAADAISAVEEPLEPPEWEPNGRDTAPDWRMQLAGGRVADVEVIRSTDEDAVWFMQSLAPDGSARVRRDTRLSHEWTILVTDQSPATNRGLGLRKLMDSVCDTLASVENEHHAPEQMSEIARWKLRLNAEAGHYFGGSRHIYVLKEPHHVGDGRGSVSTRQAPFRGSGRFHEVPDSPQTPKKNCYARVLTLPGVPGNPTTTVGQSGDMRVRFARRRNPTLVALPLTFGL